MAHAGGGLLHIDLGVGLAEGHGVAHAAGQIVAHPLHHKAGEQLPNEDKEENGQNPADQEGQKGIGLGGDLGAEHDVRVLPQLIQQPLAVIRPDAGLVVAGPSCLIVGDKDDLTAVLVQSHLRDLMVVHHGEELAVRYLDHLSLQHRGEEKDVEEHQGHQGQGIVENQRFFGRAWGFPIILDLLHTRILRYPNNIFCAK